MNEISDQVYMYFDNYYIIGLVGKQGAGKTFVSSKVSEAFKNLGYDVYIMSFATPIRSFLKEIGVTKTTFKRTIRTPKELKQKLLSFIPAPYLVTKYLMKLYDIYNDFTISNVERYRLLAQYIGTEIGREYSPDIWVRQLLDKVVLDPDTKIIIDDIRFINEYEALQDYNTAIVNIKSLDTLKKQINPTHKSEVEAEKIMKLADFDIFNYTDALVIKPRPLRE